MGISQHNNKGLNRMEVGCERFGSEDGWVTWKWKPKERPGLEFCPRLQT